MEGVSVFDLNLVREDSLFQGAMCLVTLPLSELIARRREYLSETESRRYDAIPVDRRRFSFLSGRMAAKEALRRLRPSLDAWRFEIAAGVFGQPILPGVELHGLQAAISHSDRTGAAIAFPEAHPMGIDVESVCADRTGTIRSQMTPGELQFHRSLPCPECVGYTLLWTVKESLSKVLKCGMMTPFTVLEIEKISPAEGMWVSTFRNFAQYKVLSRIGEIEVLSLALPKRTELTVAETD